VRKQTRTWRVTSLLFGGISLLVATMCLPRCAQAVTSIECEILIEDGDSLIPGQIPIPIIGINAGEDGEPGETPPPFFPPIPPPSPGPPEIVYVDPGSGPVTGATDVTIYGWNFDEASQVGFNFYTFPPGSVTVNLATEEGVLDEIQITTPPAFLISPPLEYNFGPVNVTVVNPVGDNAGSDTLVDGFVYLSPSAFPGIPGSSTLSRVEVILATSVMDEFMEIYEEARDNFEGWVLNSDEVRRRLRLFLDQTFASVTLWVDGPSDLEEENGVFLYFFHEEEELCNVSDDRPLRRLRDGQDCVGEPDSVLDGVIDADENTSAEVYENFIPGSRGRIVSFARNRVLGSILRTNWTYDDDPCVSFQDEIRSFREPDTMELMDQISYTFLCEWPAHLPNQLLQVVDPPTPLVAPGLGYPADNPGFPPGQSWDFVPAHASNQFLGSDEPPEEEEISYFEGFDYFVTIQPGLSYPEGAYTTGRILDLTPANPIFQTLGHPPGIETSPPPPADAAFEGCDPDASLQILPPYGVNGLFYIPDPDEGIVIHYHVPAERRRVRFDNVGYSIEGVHGEPVIPRILPLEEPVDVIQIEASGGDSENPVFIDRVTVTLTDIGGGDMFGRAPNRFFAGDGNFNPWTGFKSMEAEYGWQGVEFYKDADNNGEFDPDSDILLVCLSNEVTLINPMDPLNPVTILESLYGPYTYMRYPTGGWLPRDDPEWTIVLNLGSGFNRWLVRPPREDDREPEQMTSDPDNRADFALDYADAADEEPDFFVVVNCDSGYMDSSGSTGDGTGIEYGADFRAYIKENVLIDPYDPLNQLAQNVAGQGYWYPGGILLSVQDTTIGGLGPWRTLTMPEGAGGPHSAVLRTYDYIHVYNTATPWETAPFLQRADVSLAGPRTPFFPRPPIFPRPDGTLGQVSDLGWYVPTGQIFWPNALQYAQGPDDPPLTLYEERNFFEDSSGHRVLSQRIDSTSLPTPFLAINVVNTTDPVVRAQNDLAIERIDMYLVSRDRHGPTGFEPSDLLPMTDDGLGDSGISLWQDNKEGPTVAYFDLDDDTQVPLIVAVIGHSPETIEMDDIPQDRTGDGNPDPDLWGYPVTIKPVTAWPVPTNDGFIPASMSEEGIESWGQELFIVLQTSDTVSYGDRLEVVIPAGGIKFHPTGQSSVSGTSRYDFEFVHSGELMGEEDVWILWGMPAPIEIGDYYLVDDDYTRGFSISQARANVPTEINVLTTATIDTDDDNEADTQEIIAGSDPIPVLGLDIATLTEEGENVEVYLERLVVEFYNQGDDENDDGIPDDEDFNPLVDLLPLRKTVRVQLFNYVLPTGLTSATIESWLVTAGTTVDVGDPVVDVTVINPVTQQETTQTLNSTQAGQIVSIGPPVGTLVDADDTLFTVAAIGAGIALYRDNDDHPDNTNGEFDPPEIVTNPTTGDVSLEFVDEPVDLDDQPDLVGVSGEPPIQVRMVFSSPGVDDYAGSVDPPWPEELPLASQPDLRQRVPRTFGRDQTGSFIPDDPDAGDDFFVVIQTSSNMAIGDDFSVGIASWGSDTPTGVDPDTFSAPPQPTQPSDEYEILRHANYGSRAVGFVEILPPSDPAPFKWLRTQSCEQVETDILRSRTGVAPPEPPDDDDDDDGGGGGDGYDYGGGGGGGGCFIATAAFGSPYEEHVAALIAFRDRYLLTNACGTWLVRQYYTVSPRLADFVAKHDGVRYVVRQAIRPLALGAKLWLRTSAAGKIVAALAVALFFIGLVRTRRIRRFVTVKIENRR